VDPTSGEELHGNDVEGVLCIKNSWPSMARTIWGAHDRFMDVYLKPYPGYYVLAIKRAANRSLRVMAPEEIMKDFTGFEDVSMMLSMSVAIVCRLQKSKLHWSCTKVSLKQPSSELKMNSLDNVPLSSSLLMYSRQCVCISQR
jgi:hypothetical protein